MDFLRKLFDNNERDIRKYRKVVETVNAIESTFKKLTDEELKAKTEEFRLRVVTQVCAKVEDKIAMIEAEFTRRAEELLGNSELTDEQRKAQTEEFRRLTAGFAVGLVLGFFAAVLAVGLAGGLAVGLAAGLAGLLAPALAADLEAVALTVVACFFTAFFGGGALFTVDLLIRSPRRALYLLGVAGAGRQV